VSDRVLQVGVVGAGLIGQAVHLPNLARMSERFAIAAIADPSPTIADAMAARYAPARAYMDWRELLDREELDALVVCSPHATHAEVVLAALDAGVHAFVEKPLCIAVEDAARIAARARETRLVVQVGYMKRYSAAYEAFVLGLPDSPEALRLIDVLTYDPWMSREPFVPWGDMVHGDDVPAEVLAAGAEAERVQVEQAVGRGDDETVRAFSYTFLACLVHDVNLVHGALDAMGGSAAVEPLGGAAWADGQAASTTARLPGGGLWHCTWLLLPGLTEFRERVGVYFAGAVHELTFPAPYLVGAPVRHAVIDTDARGEHREQISELVSDPYAAELEHFHACVTGEATCQTPPEQAARDLATLRDLFVHQHPRSSTR
jgi:predicted dehydrogenase